MKTVTLHRVALAALFAFLSLSPACLPDGHPLAWPQIVQCGPQVDDLIPTVSRLVLDQGQPGEKFSDQAQRELEDLARQHGPEVVACLVKAVVSSFLAQDADREKAGFGADPGRMAAARRGCAAIGGAVVEVDGERECVEAADVR